MLLLLIQAIVLGLLQGLTEFLPVSSSGHLQGVPYLLGWDGSSLTFDIMVHAGTLVAVIAYFRADLWGLARGVVGAGDVSTHERRQAWALTGLLALGTLPAAAAGFFFEDIFAAAFESPRMVAGFLYVTVFLLWGAERIRRQRLRAVSVSTAEGAGAGIGAVAEDQDHDPTAGGHRDGAEAHLVPIDGEGDLGRGGDDLAVRDAVGVGLAQALAIFPGVSRSGATIAAGMALGLSRTAAARYSFLLSIPIIVGAVVSKLPDLGEPAGTGVLAFGPVETAVGVAVAAVSGYLAIRFLLAVLQRRDLLGFAKYVAGFATVLLAATFVIG